MDPADLDLALRYLPDIRAVVLRPRPRGCSRPRSPARTSGRHARRGGPLDDESLVALEGRDGPAARPPRPPHMIPTARLRIRGSARDPPRCRRSARGGVSRHGHDPGGRSRLIRSLSRAAFPPHRGRRGRVAAAPRRKRPGGSTCRVRRHSREIRADPTLPRRPGRPIRPGSARQGRHRVRTSLTRARREQSSQSSSDGTSSPELREGLALEPAGIEPAPASSGIINRHPSWIGASSRSRRRDDRERAITSVPRPSSRPPPPRGRSVDRPAAHRVG